MNTIGKRITEIREDCNITQSALADAIGITKSTMSKYEKGICIPKSDILALIADVLNTSTDYLTGRVESKKPPSPNEQWLKLSKEEFIQLQQFRNLSQINKGKIIERTEVLLEAQEKSNRIALD